MFRLGVKGKDKSKVIEEKRGTEVGEDEVIMKTKEVEAMKSAITELEKVQKRMAEIEEKCGTEVGEDEVIMKKKEVEVMRSAIAQFERVSTDESGDAKMVVMKCCTTVIVVVVNLRLNCLPGVLSWDLGL